MTTVPPELVAALRDANHIAVMTGAGVSAESGIPTFRDALSGFWSKFDPEELATPEAFLRNPGMVSRWYDERRCQCASVKPNPGHHALARLQQWQEQRGRRFTLLTQNVDRLHQTAGSSDVAELHGSLWVWRCIDCGDEQEERGPAFAEYPPRCRCGGPRRPGVVWFGELLPGPALERAFDAAATCDVFVSVGTSGLVEPAASFIRESHARGAHTLEINLGATPVSRMVDWSLPGKSGEILPNVIDQLL